MTRRELLAGIVAAGLLGAAAPLPQFVDIAAKSGITFRQETSRTSQKFLIETMGGGVGMLDYDGDGRLDLYFVNGAALQESMAGGAPDKSQPRFWNRLYRNNGDGTFTDVTEKAGVPGHSYGMGVAVADYDNDGHPDMYVTNYGRNILYHNNGDRTFLRTQPRRAFDGQEFAERITVPTRHMRSSGGAGAARLDYRLPGQFQT